MKRWISVWLGLTFVICFGSFLSSHVHIADQGHFSHLEKRLHILGRHYFELQHGRESSEIVESIPSFLLHLFDFDHDQAPFDEEAGDGIEEEEDDDDDDDDDEEEEEVEEQLTQEELDKLAAKEFSSEESTAGDEESEEGREKSNLEKVRRKRRRRRARLRRSHPNISVHRGGSGVVAPRSRVAPGSRAFNSSKGPLLHPPLKKYVESCRGSCVLKNLRRQNTKLSSSYFNTSHFDADVFFDDESECKGKCGGHGYCKEGKCICVALYEGDYCEHPIHLPHGLHADFSRDFLLNAESLKDSVGKVMSYKTNPKAGSGETHTLKLSVSQDMVNLIPESDFLRNKFFNTCAIVGSSGVLLSTMKGSEIDEHSAVIRFNKAPTKGFETYVGSKTTLRLVNTNHALFRQGNETIVQQMQSRTGWMIYRKILKMENEIPHYVFHPDFSSFVSSNTRALPTNGYFALWLALQKCSTVTMYGFYHSAGFSFPYHYFNREVPRKGGAAIHDYQAELEDILRLAKADVIHLSELCMSECHDWNNIRHYECKTCPKGSTCMCNTDMPIPVAKPGYCHPKHRRSCFVKCPGGVKQCPPVHVGDKRILGSTGRCPSEVEKTITKDSCP